MTSKRISRPAIALAAIMLVSVSGLTLGNAQEFWFRGANPDTTKDGTPRVPGGSTKDPGFTPELGGQNEPLVITTTGGSTVMMGETFTKQATANGGESPYAWSLSNAPSGMVIDSGGSISFPTSSPGEYGPIIITVSDLNDNQESVSFFAEVLEQPIEVITPPIPFIINPTQTLSAQFSYTGYVIGNVSYAIHNAPSGMIIDNSGQLAWTPNAVGNFSNVSVTVNDNDGRSGTGEPFSISVVDPGPFGFMAETGAPLATYVVSHSLIIPNVHGPLPLSVSGDGDPQARLNAGTWTSSAQTYNPGDTLQLRLESSPNPD